MTWGTIQHEVDVRLARPMTIERYGRPTCSDRSEMLRKHLHTYIMEHVQFLEFHEIRHKDAQPFGPSALAKLGPNKSSPSF